MYDTLMQMGRWFGYRDGFIDVCRLYAPDGLVEWFEHITDASNELRNDFLLMCEMGETPATYGQRVRSHPVLLVTSQVKMRHAMEMTLSYQGAISETIVFSREGKSVDKNFGAVEELVTRVDSYAERFDHPLRKPESAPVGGKYLWHQVMPDDVLEFLRQYSAPSQHVRRVNTTLLAEYIQKQVEAGDLQNWSVMLAGKSISEGDSVQIGGFTTGLIKRENHPALRQKPEKELEAYRIRRLVSPQDESWDLTEEQYNDALQLAQSESERSSPGGPEIRAVREKSNALLIIYPLEHRDFSQPISSEKPYIGFAISFPGNKNDKPVNYRVNSVYQGSFDE
jgi:hypothetical protein